MFTLAISCLTTSNLPWFMDLTFQVPMQYCSLQHQTLLPSPVTSTTRWCFHFGSVSSFFLELFLHSSPAAYWAPTYLGGSSFSVLSFCLFILFMGFSRQEYWSGLPFPSPVDQVLSELSNMTRPYGWPYTARLIVPFLSLIFLYSTAWCYLTWQLSASPIGRQQELLTSWFTALSLAPRRVPCTHRVLQKYLSWEWLITLTSTDGRKPGLERHLCLLF